MPRFKRNSLYNSGRKSRRTAKFGKYRRAAIGRKTYTYKKGQRGIVRLYSPVYVNPFARDHELVQLSFRQSITLNPNAENLTGGSPLWAFSFNNLYDPDVSGTGNQPMFFDNYAALYGRYKVSFAKIKVTIVNHFVNTTGPVSADVNTLNQSYRLAIVRDLSETDYPNQMDTLLAQNATNVKWRYVAPQLNGKLPTLSMKCAPHKTAGCSYDDDTMSALISSGPSRNVKGTVFIASADGITDPPPVRAVVEITYYAKFFDRQNNQPIN